MNLINVFILLFCSVFYAYGQEDNRSRQIIDDLTTKFKTYPGLSVDFSATVTQLQDKSEIEQRGKIWLKNDKYKLEIPEYTIYFDGAKIYQYMPDLKEVNVTRPDTNEKDEDVQMLDPRTFFDLSSKNFKSKLVKESTQYGRQVYEIDLYPVQIKTTKYSRIRIFVEKSTSQLVYLKAFLKDGMQYTLLFGKYDILRGLPDSFFTFNPAEHPGVEVIDLTF